MIELIAGGARSGKSRHAMNRAEEMSPGPVLIATATPGDEEMAQRIAHHRQERGDQWTVVEEPMDLARLVEAFGADDVVLIDCLTPWVSNWLTDGDANGWQEQKDRFLAALKEARCDIILVTNEVGQGVVPMGKLSRDFVDQSGWLHQQIAAIADRVTMMQFGIPLVLKPPPG